MTEQIFGKNAIIEVLQNDPKKVEKIVIDKNYKSDKINNIINLCKKNGIRFDIVPSLISFNADGKGVIAIVSPFSYSVLNSHELIGITTVVILDEIEDPHNFGAIIRSAAAAGCELIIIPERNAVQVTDTVINVSAGTIFKIKISKVKNIATAMEVLKANGFWITGTDMDGAADFRNYDFTDKAAIVIGNEGKGLRRLVKEKCDDIVRIDLDNGVESLNVSVAAALILFERKRKRN